ncbi:LuxR C-terminal-related transcriptional regulator [Streptomyces sp. NPDC050625]|uniref:helix-turn-helix transcriptional regulator n=1 Tax=Streptomyces sp. NPDC050625 TaxID=3154629 RepID=UPI00341D50CE
MGRGRLWGRQDERAALDRSLADAAAHRALVVLRGARGTGRTALLDAVADTWRATGVQVITTRFGDTADPADTFGIHAVVRAVRNHVQELGEPHLTDAIDGLSRLCAGRPWTRPEQTVPLLELAAVFDLISAAAPVALLVDDADEVAEPAAVLDAACRPGCLVVAAIRDEAAPDAATTQLATLADLVIDLPPLAEEHLRPLLAERYPAPLDEALLPALCQALGPLTGNLGAVLATLADLQARKRLTPVHGRLCLGAPDQPIALAADGPAGPLELLGEDASMVAGLVALGPVGLDELPLLAAAGGKRAADCGRLVDTLVDRGVLELDTDGRLRHRSPALAALLRERADPAVAAALRRSLAEAARRRFTAGLPVDPAALADRVAHAGPELPRDLELGRLLVALAARPDEEPARAAKWLRAAWWHASDERLRTRLVSPLLRQLVRAGDYARLGETVAMILADHGASPALRAELAEAAMLAAVHTGVPVPASTVRALVTDDGGAPGTIAFAAAWSTGREPRRPEGAGPEAPATRVARALFAAGGSADPDLAAVFERALGSHYTVPPDSVPGLYRRVVHGYAHGDLTAALSAARQLELTGTADTPAHRHGRLLAAEICRTRGDLRQALGWLEAVPADGICLALRGWVECGVLRLRHEATDADDHAAFAASWRVYKRLQGQGTRHGLAGLIPRLARMAVAAGEHRRARELLAAIEWRCAQDPDPLLAEAQLLTRAVVTRDLAAAEAGAELARRRGHQPALLTACLMVGELSDAPRTWLREAYELAGSFDSAYLRGRIRTLMRGRGVSTPRTRVRRETFSPTELRIIELICEGRTNRQIARQEQMSEKTIEDHLDRLFARTGCRSRLQLATASLAGRLIAADPARVPA